MRRRRLGRPATANAEGGGIGATPDRPIVVVQARIGSRRLPGKVLADVCGRPLLARLLERLATTRLAAGLVVATSARGVDDPVAGLCAGLGVDVVRGPEDDVLARFVQAADATGAPALARLSADSPLLDGAVVDRVVADFLRGGAELVENHTRAGWPVGTAVEVLTATALRRLDREATEPQHREHVTLFAYDHPGRFSVRYVEPPPELRRPSLRLCVDTAADLERVREIFSRFAPRASFGLDEVLAAEGPAAW